MAMLQDPIGYIVASFAKKEKDKNNPLYPFFESVGFDITAMTKELLGIELEWSIDGSLPKHITLVTALFLPDTSVANPCLTTCGRQKTQPSPGK